MSRKTVNELIERYRKTLADGQFSRGEKKAIAQLLDEANLDEHQVDLLRSRLFKLAKGRVANARAHDALDWLEKANKTLPNQPAARSTSRVFYSPGRSCLGAITSLIKSARRSLDICVFTITDDRITNKIVDADRRGVAVRIITDNDKAFDTGSDALRLARAGIAVRIDDTPDHMHHKFALIDGNTTLTGSYNWTRSAAAHNFENLVVTDDQAIVRSYAKEFERLWRIMKRKV
ncbi:MAG: cardiolipin hydrolase [Limisphaerales bacterium]|jgi:cardiolipin hydrolase